MLKCEICRRLVEENELQEVCWYFPDPRTRCLECAEREAMQAHGDALADVDAKYKAMEDE